MTIICLDTTWTIDFFRNREEAVQRLKQLRAENSILATTTATVFETLYGFLVRSDHEKTQQAVQFFKSLPLIFTLDFEASCKAAEVAAELARRGNAINQFDSLIAGSMLRNGCTKIVTTNTKDFSKIKGITIR